MNRISDIRRMLIVLTVVLGMLFLYRFISEWGIVGLLSDIDSLMLSIRSSGRVGPLMIIALMMLAIVFNPLPSAPIALASGALYGHGWGTVYVIIGALLGAVTAFSITRYTGYYYVQRLASRGGFSAGRYASQNALMLYVFISRLIPFISFDLVSYAAGLTTLSFWRFALATLVGLVPTSFLLAHFGGEMADMNLSRLSLWVLLAGLITTPLLIYKLYRHYRKSELQEARR